MAYWMLFYVTDSSLNKFCDFSGDPSKRQRLPEDGAQEGNPERRDERQHRQGDSVRVTERGEPGPSPSSSRSRDTSYGRSEPSPSTSFRSRSISSGSGEPSPSTSSGNRAGDIGSVRSEFRPSTSSEAGRGYVSRRDSDAGSGNGGRHGDDQSLDQGHGSQDDSRGRGYVGRGRGFCGSDRGRGAGVRGRGGFEGGRGEGRGRGGRGRGRGARGGRREIDAEYDMVISRPTVDGAMMSKQAVPDEKCFQPTRLRANFFQVECQTNWCIYHYRVDFSPDETDTRIKKKLLKAHGDTIGAYIFDGSSLYVSHRLTPDVSVSLFIQTSEKYMHGNYNEKHFFVAAHDTLFTT